MLPVVIFFITTLLHDLFWANKILNVGQHDRNYIFVYRKGDIVKQPMKKDSFVPKDVPGVGGWGGVGWVCHVGWGGVGHVGVGWGGS